MHIPTDDMDMQMCHGGVSVHADPDLLRPVPTPGDGLFPILESSETGCVSGRELAEETLEFFGCKLRGGGDGCAALG
jgi:hypothetical protein